LAIFTSGPVPAEHRGDVGIGVERREELGVVGWSAAGADPAAADRDAGVVQRAQYQLDGAVEVGGDLGDGPLPVVVELAQLGDVEGVAVFPRGPGSDRDAGGAEPAAGRLRIGAVPLADGRGR